MRKTRTSQRLAAVLLGALALSSFATALEEEETVKPGLRYRLSEESTRTEEQPAERTVAGDELPADATRRLLDRAPDLPAPGDDVGKPSFPPRTLPPPRPGRTIDTPFPPTGERDVPETPDPGPLTVLRQSPVGDVDAATQISVTFSQPMVAVDTHDSLAAQAVPVRLEPAVDGSWRWVGTRTLLFEAVSDSEEPERARLPMATAYRATIPAGTRSALGKSLESEVAWEFTTPAPRIVSSSPRGESVSREPLIQLGFDQRVEGALVAELLRVVAGGATLGARLATDAEIAAIDGAGRIRDAVAAGTLVVLRCRDRLPASTEVRVELPSGAPSAEGPLRTPAPQSFTFTTHGPLEVKETRCGWSRRELCRPGEPLRIEMTNALDAESFDESLVRVEPELSRVRFFTSGNAIWVNGPTRSQTEYHVILDPAIRDAFGQTLGEEHVLIFKTGDPEPMLRSTSGPLAVLDPWGPPTFSIWSTGHERLRLRTYAVEPKDWGAYREYLRNWQRRGAEAKLPGRLVGERDLVVDSVDGDLIETRIDLRREVREGGRQLVISVEPETQPNPRRPQVVLAWLQSTQIAIDAIADDQSLWAWTSSLTDGSPLDDTRVELLPHEASSGTDEHGIARFELPTEQAKGSALLVARRGDDIAILPESFYWWSQGSDWVRSERRDVLRWMVFDDRGMYRPGEEVHVKGWVRRLKPGPRGDLAGAGEDLRSVAWTAFDPRNNEVAKGTVEVSALGGFDLSFRLPAEANLGYARLSLDAEGVDGARGTKAWHTYQVQEFRRPEFEVGASASSGPHLVGSSATITASARYYAGGALGDAPVTWSLTAKPGNYTPPGRDDFTFGTWTPWWRSWSPDGDAEETRTFQGRTDVEGLHRLRVDLEAVEPPRPMVLDAQAAVTDVNRQTWTASASLLVHPSAVYVGLHGESYFVRQGMPLRIAAIACDLDGKALAGIAMPIECYRVEWKQQKGLWEEVESLAARVDLVSADGAVEATLPDLEGGMYRVRSTVRDAAGRANRSEITLWVAGGKQPVSRSVDQEEVTLIPDAKTYAAGDTARILVQAPFTPAEGLLTIRRDGVLRMERFRMEESTRTIEISIEDDHTPNLDVLVDLVGAADRVEDDGEVNPRLPKRPAYASGSIVLPVPPVKRELKVSAKPVATTVTPGEETSVDVVVHDAEGHAASGAEVAVVVVDEAVLALSGYSAVDPLGIFYAQRGAGTQQHHLRRFVQLRRLEERFADAAEGEDSDDFALAEDAAPAAAEAGGVRMMRGLAAKKGEAQGGGAGGDSPIAVRTNFDALALFAAKVVTDEDGTARVSFRMPDSLTRYRVMAWAVAGERRFGKGESHVTAQLPLMVRPSAPRFLNYGDRFELPVVLQNLTEEPLTVDLALETSNLSLLGSSARRVSVPAADRVEVRFACGTELPGAALVQIVASTGSWSDAARVTVPVRTPATTEAFAVYGEIGSGDPSTLLQPIARPEGVTPGFGGLDLTTSSTALQGLTDAFIYVLEYPYGCTEQVASRVLTVAALRDVLAAFDAEGLPDPETLVAAVGRDIQKLEGLQNGDGGFSFWRRDDRSWPWLGAHVTHALARAREKGFAVSDRVLRRSERYLADIDRHFPADWPDSCRRSTKAYALYARALIAPDDKAAAAVREEARKLLNSVDLGELPLEACGWLLTTIAGDDRSVRERSAVVRHLVNRASETASTAEFRTSYADGAHLVLHSSRRTDAVVLEALLAEKAQVDLATKVVHGLLAHRKRGRWLNTQENASVLVALDRYFREREAETPHFVARAWLGETFISEQGYRGREVDRHRVEVPMQTLLASDGDRGLILQKEGAGRLYWRVGLTYAPDDLDLDASDHGFTVRREYSAVDDPADVRQDEDGTWRVRLGARVRTRLTMVAPTRRYHVALVDSLPAGLESLNPALAVTGDVPEDEDANASRRGRGYWFWWRTWYEHQNLRDDRAEAFASLLPAGVWTWSYVSRATTPGSFVVPPPKAEEMYQPETFGRGATDRVVIE